MPSHGDPIDRRVTALLLVLVVTALGSFLWTRTYDGDEFQSIHTAWMLLQGDRIYLDFHQQHHPVFYFLLVPIVALLGTNTTTIEWCSWLMLLFSAGIVYFTHALARAAFDSRVAISASLILPLIPWFAASGIEVRPDVPLVCFGMASLYFMHRYREEGDARHVVAAGVSVALAIVFLQKAVFYGPPLVWLLAGGLFRSARPARDLFLCAAGFAAVAGIFLVFVSSVTTFAAYYSMCFEYVRVRQADLGGAPNLPLLFREATQPYRLWLPLSAITLAGVVVTLTSRRSVEFGLAALWFLGTILLVAQPYEQYLLPATPLMAISIAVGFGCWIDRTRLAGRVATLVVIAAGAINLVVWGFASLPERRTQMDKVDYVLSITSPDDRVYDGAARFNVFRRDLDFIWLIGSETVASHETYARLVPYDYDVFEAIDELRPAVISHYFPPSDTPPAWVAWRYRRSPGFDDVYLRIANLTGFDHWTTFVDELGTGSRVEPRRHLFRPDGTLRVEMHLGHRGETSAYGSQRYPYVGLDLRFRLDGSPMDLSPHGGVWLSYRSTGPLSLLVSSASIESEHAYRVPLPSSNSFEPRYFAWETFRQPSWVSTPTVLDTNAIQGLGFIVAGDQPAKAVLHIRRVRPGSPSSLQPADDRLVE